MLRMCRTLSSAFMATLVVLSLASLTAVLAASEYVVEKNTVRLVLPAGLSSEYNDLLKFDAAYGDFGEIPYDQVSARSREGLPDWMDRVAFWIKRVCTS